MQRVLGRRPGGRGGGRRRRHPPAGLVRFSVEGVNVGGAELVDGAVQRPLAGQRGTTLGGPHGVVHLVRADGGRHVLVGGHVVVRTDVLVERQAVQPRIVRAFRLRFEIGWWGAQVEVQFGVLLNRNIPVFVRAVAMATTIRGPVQPGGSADVGARGVALVFGGRPARGHHL